jgi:hypothetical protein
MLRVTVQKLENTSLGISLLVESSLEAVKILGCPTTQTSANIGIRCIQSGLRNSVPQLEHLNRGCLGISGDNAIAMSSWLPFSAYKVMLQIGEIHMYTSE